jgi:hypothetical protein
MVFRKEIWVRVVRPSVVEVVGDKRGSREGAVRMVAMNTL